MMERIQTLETTAITKLFIFITSTVLLVAKSIEQTPRWRLLHAIMITTFLVWQLAAVVGLLTGAT